jgi:hypothetical protein
MTDWDQEQFDAALSECVAKSSRTATEVVNSHAYYIARKACWFTHKADKTEIQTSLGKFITSKRHMTSRVANLAPARDYDAPLAALIVNARRGEKGLPGLYGAEMTRAIAAMLGARLRSIAFLKSGWLPAIRILEGYATDKSKGAPTDRDAVVRGQEKGSAIPAIDGHEVVAKIINSALAQGDEGGKALAKWGEAGLELAFYDETESMKQHLADKLAQVTAETNTKL